MSVNPAWKSVFIAAIYIGFLVRIGYASGQPVDADYVLASRFAPAIHLSAPDSNGSQVDLLSGTYPYSDYFPMRVDNLLSSPPQSTVELRLKGPVTIGQSVIPAGDYPLDYPGYINLLGIQGIRSASNSLLFDPLWDESPDPSQSYKERAGQPAVYYRVFRNSDSGHPSAIAVQYWFFYFYNDWLQKHPGDWESVTVFLNSESSPLEVIFSSNLEANKFSWANELLEEYRDGDHFSVFVSNGAHGSYAFPGETDYSGVRDRHWGDGGTLSFQSGDYQLIDLGKLENDNQSWIWFQGRWGNDGVDIVEGQDPSPFGPKFRKDAATGGDWFRAENRPYDPFNECTRRDYGANIYDPWYWAAGYGRDVPWTSVADCIEASFNIQAPANLERVVAGNQLTMRWQPISNAMSYRVRVEASSGVGSFEFDTNGLSQFSRRLNEGTYHVSVVAYNQFTASNPSSEIVITAGQQSTPLSPPADLLVDVDNNRVALSWAEVFGAHGYLIQYGVAPGQYLGVVDVGDLTKINAELDIGTYYIRVAGYDENREPGLYTEEARIFVSAPLAVPEVLSPGTTSPPVPKISGTSVALRWTAVPGATMYKLTLLDSTTNKLIASGLAVQSTFFVVTDLVPGRSYWWVVEACNESTCSNSSTRRYFQVN